MNDAYKQLVSVLDKEEKGLLKKSQLAWLKTRNDSCSMREKDQFYVNLSCATVMTEARVNELGERQRERKATGCRKSKL